MTRMSNLPGSGGVRGKGLAAAPRAPWLRRWAPWIALAYILIAGLFVAWAKMETTQLTYEVHRLRAERAELQREQQRLTTNVAGLHAPVHLTAEAEKIGLVRPDPAAVIHMD